MYPLTSLTKFAENLLYLWISHNYRNGGGSSCFVITRVKLETRGSMSLEINLLHESGTQKYRLVSRYFVQVRHPVVFFYN